MASRAMWVTCLSSGCRTAVACSVVACATLYGPAALRRHVTFPAFSYVTAILIVTNATVGDAVRGCWLALYASLQTVCPAMLVFWFIGPSKFSYETIALTVALASVVVVLPSSTHLLAKRIALGQIVIIYVVGFIGGAHTEPLMHPLHVAATTAMGAAASVCATLLPFPRLATLEVKEKSKEVVDNVAERLRLLVKALLSDNDALAAGSISKASLLSTSATKVLRHIKQYQPSMQWEWIPLKKFRPGPLNSAKRLQDLGTPLRGMELALSNIPSYPLQTLQNQALKDSLNALENHIRQSLNQSNTYPPSDSHTFPKSNPDDHTIKTIDSIQTMPTNDQDLPALFFIFCMKLLCSNNNKPQPQPNNKSQPQKPNQSKTAIWRTWAPQAMPALKSAISLGIAVFLGLMYSKENGFWASLGVAVSIGSGREATFKGSNLKLQGTVVGSVYGVLCFVGFENFLLGRLLCLLPWFVFAGFLQRSRMYGPAGGVSAVIAAVIILGRTNYGSARELAFARIVETIIGVSSSIIVDILLQVTRASKMAKIQLDANLRSLKKCIDLVSFSSEADMAASRKALGMEVGELKKFIDEADVEPNFWFTPFHSSCYGKLFKSFSRLVDLFGFIAHAMRILQQNDLGENIDDDLEEFKEMASGSVTCSLKSLRMFEKEAEMKKSSDRGDLEMGEPREIETTEKLVVSFLQHSAEVIEIGEGDKSEAILGLSALGFCLSALMREMEEIGKATRELVQWENPSTHVEFGEITSKIHDVHN